MQHPAISPADSVNPRRRCRSQGAGPHSHAPGRPAACAPMRAAPRCGRSRRAAPQSSPRPRRPSGHGLDFNGTRLLRTGHDALLRPGSDLVRLRPSPDSADETAATVPAAAARSCGRRRHQERCRLQHPSSPLRRASATRGGGGGLYGAIATPGPAGIIASERMVKERQIRWTLRRQPGARSSGAPGVSSPAWSRSPATAVAYPPCQKPGDVSRSWQHLSDSLNRRRHMQTSPSAQRDP